MRRSLALIFFIAVQIVTAQDRGGVSAELPGPEAEEEVEVEPAPIALYKIISVENDTTFVDTSLSIYQDYRFNYLREDNFELLAFSNVGQAYNRLSYDFGEELDIFPELGARAKAHAFMDVDDIHYYHVPTPFTELFFRTVFEQGQLLDAFFTVNLSPDFNFSIAYKGLRSMGKYQHILTSSGSFRSTISYNSPDDRYHAKAHFVAQDIYGDDNGGLTDQALSQYLLEEPEFQDRSRLEVNYENAGNTLTGKRFYLEHLYDLVKRRDSLNPGGLSIGHELQITDDEFLFEQEAAEELIGPSFESINIEDNAELEFISNAAFLQFKSNPLGKVRAKLKHYHYEYGYNSVLVLQDEVISNKLTGDMISVGGAYEKRLGRLYLETEGLLNVSGNFDGYGLDAHIAYLIDEDLIGAAGLKSTSSPANFNFLLFQSDYISYNWQNNFNNLKTNQLFVEVTAPRYLEVKADVTNLTDYVYFGLDQNDNVKPFQFSEKINYFRIRAQKEFRFGKFALNNTFLYQKVLEGEEVLHVPTFITRNTLYFTDQWFQKALFLQTGFTFKYFDNYMMNAYDPVLGEFYIQNEQVFDGIPTVDFFFNGKVRQARIFFKLEHVDTLVLGNNKLSAPLYPYRDFGIRFGLLWNFFM